MINYCLLFSKKLYIEKGINCDYTAIHIERIEYQEHGTNLTNL